MIVTSDIRLDPGELSERELRRLLTRLTFRDAEQDEVKAYRLLRGGRVRLPRGAWALLPDHVEYEDGRIAPTRQTRSIRFRRTLDAPGFSGQQKALRALMHEEQGIVLAQPGFGKTEVALAFVSQINTPTIVFVHTEDIFNQWMERTKRDLNGAKVGMIQGSNWVMGDIVIAMVQTVYRSMGEFRKEWADKFGAVIIDECHHSPADMWMQILSSLPAKYRVGFTATQTRADGKHPLMKHLIGPVVYEHKFKAKIPVRVIPLKTEFEYGYRGAFDWPTLQNRLVRDEDRNSLIAKAAVRQMKKGRSVLVLSRRIEHLQHIQDHMFKEFEFDAGWTQQISTLTGSVVRPKRKSMLAEFRAGKLRCLLATQLADEALDVPILACVILTYPGKHDGRIIQQVGRAIREHPGKRGAIIFDVVDDKVGVLRRQWMERKATYKKIGLPVKKSEQKEERYGTATQRRRAVARKVRERLGRGRAQGSRK